jgi:hypothetical protein
MAAMAESEASYQDYTFGGQQPAGGERLSLGAALLAVFGLSALGWAAVLTPIFTILIR